MEWENKRRKRVELFRGSGENGKSKRFGCRANSSEKWPRYSVEPLSPGSRDERVEQGNLPRTLFIPSSSIASPSPIACSLQQMHKDYDRSHVQTTNLSRARASAHRPMDASHIQAQFGCASLHPIIILSSNDFAVYVR